MAAADSKPLSFGLLLFDGFEVLDAAGPIELLNMLVATSDDKDPTLSVITESVEPVRPGTGAGFTNAQAYLPTHTFDTAPELDVLIVPGGRGTRKPLEMLQPMLDFLRASYRGTSGRRPLQYLFSICTGPGLLAPGWIAGRS